MRRCARRPIARAVAAAALLLLACDGSREDAGVAAPAAPTASASLRNGVLRIADIAVIEITVTSSPNSQLLPPALPDAIPGFDGIAWDAGPVEHESRRWVHRSSVRLRAREIGRFEWPALELSVAVPDGPPQRIALRAVPLEVVSILAEHPRRTAPFGARSAPRLPPTSRTLPRAVIAAAIAVAGVVLFAIARTRRNATPPAPAAITPWSAAGRDLGRADALAEDPVVASHLAAAALCRYMATRFGVDSRARTTEELAAATPPYGARSHWPAFVELLVAFDALRFPPAIAADRARQARAFAGESARAHEFVAATTPPEALQ